MDGRNKSLETFNCNSVDIMEKMSTNLGNKTNYEIIVKTEPDLDLGIDFVGACDFLTTEDFSVDNIEQMNEKNGSKKGFKRREKKYTNCKEYYCNICSYKSYNRSNFTRHLFRHTGDKPYYCSLCQYSFTEACDLRRHMNIHIGRQLFECNDCDFTASKKYTLKYHILLKHLGVKLNKVKKFSCDICDYKGYLPSDIKKHRVIHFDVKPFPCSLCNYKTKTSSDLNKHLLTHTNVKPYKCDKCSYKARRNTHLKGHMKTHSKELYFCDKCSFRSYSLARHNLHLKEEHK